MLLLKKKHISFYLMPALLLFFCCSESRVDTPQKLLKRIHEIASEERYDELENHIFQFKDEHVQERIIDGIVYEQFGGDYAYSTEALETINTHLLNNIAPIDQELHKELFVKGKDLGKDERLRKLALDDLNNIQTLVYTDVAILMAKVETEYQLVFWENLTDVLTYGAVTSDESVRTSKYARAGMKRYVVDNLVVWYKADYPPFNDVIIIDDQKYSWRDLLNLKDKKWVDKLMRKVGR